MFSIVTIWGVTGGGGECWVLLEGRVVGQEGGVGGAVWIEGCVWRGEVEGGVGGWDGGRDRRVRLEGATGGRDWRVRLKGATGGCDWRVQLAGAIGGCEWRVRLEGASGGWDWRVRLDMYIIDIIEPTRR